MGIDTAPEEGQSKPILNQIRENFKWDNFNYALFFGLLPTAWDILSDYKFGTSQEAEGEETTAGLCYMFICMPTILSIHSAIASRASKEWGILKILFICLNPLTVFPFLAFVFFKQPRCALFPFHPCHQDTGGVSAHARDDRLLVERLDC